MFHARGAATSALFVWSHRAAAAAVVEHEALALLVGQGAGRRVRRAVIRSRPAVELSRQQQHGDQGFFSITPRSTTMSP